MLHSNETIRLSQRYQRNLRTAPTGDTLSSLGGVLPASFRLGNRGITHLEGPLQEFLCWGGGPLSFVMRINSNS
jgi:hypothetical protein